MPGMSDERKPVWPWIVIALTVVVVLAIIAGLAMAAWYFFVFQQVQRRW